ncbi:MAG: GHKL domain-containing protein [Desulfamplus sp.]|nr:GHKL domain-containing protein [Desulfamplus sp.]
MAFSTLVFSSNEHLPWDSRPFVYLYTLSLLLLSISVIYGIVFKWLGKNIFFVYFQLILDVFAVTFIIYITGSFNSVFTFLYLMVIIAASMLLLRKGSMIIATVCSIQYGVLIDLEYYAIIKPLIDQTPLAREVAWTHIIYRIIIIMGACFSVALLSGFLAFQAKKAKKDLKIVEDHLKRVERMAAMGEIAAGMAHEIKNPLASLSGSIQMLQEDSPPGTPNHRLMQIVLRETQRLSRIVTDFLLFARPCAGEVKTLSVPQVIQDTIAVFRQDVMYAERIEFILELQRNIVLSMDPDHLGQILWNLLKNAAESIQGSGTIFVELMKTRSGRIFLKVSDNGCGIETHDMDLVFNPFFTTKANGTGLGLSIVHRITDFYSGFVDVESEPGRGTTVTLVFRDNPGNTMQESLETCIKEPLMSI